MVVFSNRWLGPSAELVVSRAVASAMLADLSAAARASVASRWERELVEWLGELSAAEISALDVDDIAWTPEHFEVQRELLLGAFERAAKASSHERALRAWSRMIAAYPLAAVRVGRRWLIPSGPMREHERSRNNPGDAGDGTGSREASRRVGTDGVSLGR